MSSTIALPRIRFRVRRRRPSQREVIHALVVGGMISQAGWLALQLMRGIWVDGLILLTYPPMLWVLSTVRERWRYYEAHGLMPPVTWEDWLIPFCLWTVQIVLWGWAT